MAFQKLQVELLKHSQVKCWSGVRWEWCSVGRYTRKEWHECVCGRQVKRLAPIQSRLTGKSLILGWRCASRFFSKVPQESFRALRGVSLNEPLRLDGEILLNAYECDVISGMEHGDYLRLLRQRNLMTAEVQFKREVEGKVFRAFVG